MKVLIYSRLYAVSWPLGPIASNSYDVLIDTLLIACSSF